MDIVHYLLLVLLLVCHVHSLSLSVIIVRRKLIARVAIFPTLLLVCAGLITINYIVQSVLDVLSLNHELIFTVYKLQLWLQSMYCYKNVLCFIYTNPPPPLQVVY